MPKMFRNERGGIELPMLVALVIVVAVLIYNFVDFKSPAMAKSVIGSVETREKKISRGNTEYVAAVYREVTVLSNPAPQPYNSRLSIVAFETENAVAAGVVSTADGILPGQKIRCRFDAILTYPTVRFYTGLIGCEPINR